MSEETLLDENVVTATGPRVVTLTTSRVVIGDTTYALKNITSVKVTRVPFNGYGCGMLLLVFGVLIILMAPIQLVLWLAGIQPEENPTPVGAWFMAIPGAVIFFLVPGYYLKKYSIVHCNVVFSTSAGQVQALQSTDAGFIDRFEKAINDAMARG